VRNVSEFSYRVTRRDSLRTLPILRKKDAYGIAAVERVHLAPIKLSLIFFRVVSLLRLDFALPPVSVSIILAVGTGPAVVSLDY
jgi:hypothetical protein